MTTWLDNSEIVCGLAIEETINPQYIELSLMAPPFDTIVSELQQGKPISDIVARTGLFSHVQAARNAVEIASEMDFNPTEWLGILHTSKVQADAAEALKRQIKRLEAGEGLDFLQIDKVVDSLKEDITDVKTFADIEPAGDKDLWQSAGWGPLDDHLKGLPKSGLLTIAGAPGNGKTSLGLKIVAQKVKSDPEAKALIFSQEMEDSQLLTRALEIEGRSLTKENQSRIIVKDELMSIQSIYSYATQLCSVEPVKVILIDFADLVIQGEVSAASMEEVYRTCAKLAKQTRTTVILLAQFNDKYTGGGIPKIHWLRWSRMAEALSTVVLMLYNPNQIMSDASSRALPYKDGTAWVVMGKSRYGCRHETLGAFRVGFKGAKAWDNKSDFEDDWVPIQRLDK